MADDGMCDEVDTEIDRDGVGPRILLPPHLEERRPALARAADGLGLAGAVVFATSGSSGDPKFVVHDAASVRASADAVNAHLGATRDDVWLRALPGFHVGGFAIRERAVAAACGFEEWSARWDPAGFVRVVAEAGATLTSLVPTQVHDLVSGRHRAPRSLRAVVVGGARLEPGLASAARGLGWPVLASYGSTEAGSQVATEAPEGDAGGPAADDRPLRLLPGWTVRADPEGRLSIRGPALFRGYLVTGAEPDGGRLDCPLVDGWFETTDRARLVVDGQGIASALRDVTRADDCVKVLGEMVALGRVEEDLATHLRRWTAPRSAVGEIEIVVLAVPDERAGHRLVAVVESDGGQGTDASLAEAVRAFNEGVPGFRRITEGWATDALPRSALGKVLRAALAEGLRAGGARRFW